MSFGWRTDSTRGCTPFVRLLSFLVTDFEAPVCPKHPLPNSYVNGRSAIYGFPFRIYSEPFLSACEVVSSGRGFRYRVHRPFVVRPAGSPLSPEVPFEKWPAFEWNATVPERDRIGPPSGITATPDTRSDEMLFNWSPATPSAGPQPRPVGGDVRQPIRAYDALRVDVWGGTAEIEVERFVVALLDWMRRLTFQPWIGDYQAMGDSAVKATFEIDADGRAIVSPYARGAFFIWPEAQPLSGVSFQEAVYRASRGEEVEQYWRLYFDAINYLGRRRTNETVLALTLSLEIARNTIYPKFAPSKVKSGLGAVLVKPFDDTDLLAHLSTRLGAYRMRNLATEDSATFRHVNGLYTARHHVAHGKPAIVMTSKGAEAPSNKTLMDWAAATRKTLEWMESL